MTVVLPSSAEELQADRSRMPSWMEFGLEVKLDAFSMVVGGAERGTALLGFVEASVTLDSEAAGLWSGGRLYTSLLGTAGDSAGELAGAIQGIDNIEAGDDLRIFECWFEQRIGARTSVLAGYQDFNSEFDVIESAAELLNPSFGIGPDMSQLGLSLFPRTHLGARVRVDPTEGVYVQGAVYESPDLPSFGSTASPAPQGLFAAGEGGVEFGPDNRSTRLALGYWHVSSDAEDSAIAGSDLSGRYAIAEQRFGPADGRAITLFARWGDLSSQEVSFRSYSGGGIRVRAPLRSRPDDIVTLGVAHAGLSVEGVGASMERASETTWELTWVWRLSDRVSIQPDLQYVRNPAGSTAIDDARMAGLRVTITN